MKKVNTLIVLLTLSFMFNSCHRDDDSIEKEDPKSGFFIPYKGRPSNMLGYGEIVSMLRSYDDTRKNVLKRELGFEDTRMNFYDLELLENYIAYIKQISKEKEIKLTGFNIISAAYPKRYGDGDGGEGERSKEPWYYDGYQTLIFMPTTNLDGKRVTFDPLQSERRKPVTFRDILTDYGYKWDYDGVEEGEGGEELGRRDQNRKSRFIPVREEELFSSGSNRMNVVPPRGM